MAIRPHQSIETSVNFLHVSWRLLRNDRERGVGRLVLPQADAASCENCHVASDQCVLPFICENAQQVEADVGEVLPATTQRSRCSDGTRAGRSMLTGANAIDLH